MIDARKSIMLDKALEIAAYESLLDKLEEFRADIDDNEYQLDDLIKKRIGRLFKKQRREERRENRSKNRAYRAFKAASVTIAVFLSVSFAGVMTVEAVREEVYQALLEVTDKFFAVFIRHDTDDLTEQNPPVTYGIYEPTYLPEGFSYTSESDMLTGYKILYRSQDGARISIVQYPLVVSLDYHVDGEKHDITPIEIGDFVGYSFKVTGDDLILHCTFQNSTHAFFVHGEVSEDEIYMVIESLTLR